ncbi:aldolase/citrate lyase family protein [Clostridium sp. MCC353]|uniref:HpcH/HpaI aldolase family protein n=1 Tax=Clostridium sp. MCC353 TaxID=2592646 RepID=UPI002079339D|nr:aldolase/citrate lyase family protein [Clostridium sp. MCC353]
MRANMVNWKEQMKERPLFGCFVTYGLPDLAEYTASLGFDFILIDNEHGVMEQTTLCDMVRASQCEGVPAVVRCTMNEYDHVQKALDFGANGVQVPLVNTVEDAKKIVSLTHYAPLGKRGTAYLPRAAGYGMVDDKCAYREEANKVKLVSVHIETVEAVKNLDEILKVDGIDVYFIGPGDLSSSMNLPTNDPKVQETVKNCIQKIAAAGKIPGYYVGNAEATKQAMEWGARYLVTAITPYMTAGALKYLADVKGEKGSAEVKDAY